MKKEPEQSETEKKKYTSKIQQLIEFVQAEYKFRLNSVLDTLEVKFFNSVDFSEFDKKKKNDLILSLKEIGFSKPKEDLETYLGSSCIEDFNPIEDYFDNLRFAGSGYLDELLSCITLLADKYQRNYSTEELNYVVRNLMKKWFIATYRCATGRGNINDVMLILISSGQGKFKTSFLNYLTPEPLKKYSYTGAIIPSLSDYGTQLQLCEKFIVNIDDQMDNIDYRDFGKLKSILSSEFITMRKKYAVNQENRRRIASFCGSINNENFLRDVSNRRYLSIYIDSIDIEHAKRINMNAVWSEVKILSEALNEKYYTYDKSDRENIDKLNESFTVSTIEHELLVSVFKRPDEKDTRVYYLTATEILNIIQAKSGFRNIKEYNLYIAFRKEGIELISKRLQRFGGIPRKVYKVSTVFDQTNYVHSLIKDSVGGNDFFEDSV